MPNHSFLQYANSFQAIARLELESIRLLLQILGNPERELNFIHVAGTNGKGSVCAFLQEIFTCAGYTCGKYISPNMISVCERLSVNGQEITEAELEILLDKIETASEKVTETLGSPPTQFEIWTAAAFCYFKEKKCDMVILETGLGGSRDATNIIPPPKASVITRIDVDHTAYLGNTLAEITTQKAGIIKKQPNGGWGLTVTLPQSAEIMDTLKSACREKNNRLIIAQKPIVLTPNGIFERFHYANLEGLESGIAGYHQIENACIAIETSLQLGISESAIRCGLKHAKNIGRFELLEDNPPLIFDGAHNPNGMQSLMSALGRYYPNAKPALVMGMMADKDITAVLKEIKIAFNDAKVYTVTVENNERAMQAEVLSSALRKQGLSANPCPDISTACTLAKASADLVVICGSLYLYKDYVLSR